MDTVKELRITFNDDDFRALKEAKGSRTWRDAIREEFGVLEGTHE